METTILLIAILVLTAVIIGWKLSDDEVSNEDLAREWAKGQGYVISQEEEEEGTLILYLE